MLLFLESWNCDDISDPNNLVLDVRRQDEWDAGHLGCASLLTLDDTLTKEAVDDLTGSNTDVTTTQIDKIALIIYDFLFLVLH